MCELKKGARLSSNSHADRLHSLRMSIEIADVNTVQFSTCAHQMLIWVYLQFNLRISMNTSSSTVYPRRPKPHDLFDPRFVVSTIQRVICGLKMIFFEISPRPRLSVWWLPLSNNKIHVWVQVQRASIKLLLKTLLSLSAHCNLLSLKDVSECTL